MHMLLISRHAGRCKCEMYGDIPCTEGGDPEALQSSTELCVLDPDLDGTTASMPGLSSDHYPAEHDVSRPYCFKATGAHAHQSVLKVPQDHLPEWCEHLLASCITLCQTIRCVAA